MLRRTDQTDAALKQKTFHDMLQLRKAHRGKVRERFTDLATDERQQ
jgi:hypothetical protein